MKLQTVALEESFLSVFARKNVRHRNLQVSQILSENLKKIGKKITRDDLVRFDTLCLRNLKKILEKIYFDVEPLVLQVEPVLLHVEPVLLQVEPLLLQVELMPLQVELMLLDKTSINSHSVLLSISL